MDSRSMTLAEEKEMGPSTTPSFAPSAEKETKADLEDSSTEKEDESVQETPAAAPDGEDDLGEYPSGFKMAAIVAALILSIFLVSSVTLPI
jgi:MFS transporter, DHA2 family, glioxin efflux transporter